MTTSIRTSLFSTNMKVCFKCLVEKPLSEYYKHSKMRDGFLNKCKDCTKSDSTKNRNDNLEYYRQYDKDRANNPDRVAAREDYSRSEAGRVSRRKAKSKWEESNPKKRGVHIKTGNAIRDGLLFKQPCEVCGDKSVVAHHCDYDKPLDIMWLCPEHHSEWHKINGEGLNPT